MLKFFFVQTMKIYTGTRFGIHKYEFSQILTKDFLEMVWDIYLCNGPVVDNITDGSLVKNLNLLQILENWRTRHI